MVIAPNVAPSVEGVPLTWRRRKEDAVVVLPRPSVAAPPLCRWRKLAKVSRSEVSCLVLALAEE